MQRGRLRWILFPAVAGIAGYFALFGGDYGAFDLRRAQGELLESNADLDRLNAETDSLATRVDALENDPHALEEIARSEFGMLREGELLYTITGADSTAADSLDTKGEELRTGNEANEPRP